MKDKPYRPRLSAEEYEVIQKFRELNEQEEEGSDVHSNAINKFEQALEQGGFSGSWNHGWYKPDKHISLHIKNTKEEVPFEVMRQDMIDSLKKFAPKFQQVKPKHDDTTDPHCLVIDIADLHLGKLGIPDKNGEESYNSDEAIKRALLGTQGIIDKSKGFNIQKCVFVIGNDVLHVDNDNKTTTKGTPQDVSGTWYQNFQRAREMYVMILNYLVEQIGNVHVVHCPSNHDYVTGFMLADAVYSWYHNHPNITFDVSNKHRKYFQYGGNLLGFCHGDGAKHDTLAMLMPTEAREMWANTTGGYWILHHIHHKQKYKWKGGTDLPNGITVEYMRSPSGTDEWHDKLGYCHSPQAIEGKIFHKVFGEVSHITHRFV